MGGESSGGTQTLRFAGWQVGKRQIGRKTVANLMLASRRQAGMIVTGQPEPRRESWGTRTSRGPQSTPTFCTEGDQACGGQRTRCGPDTETKYSIVMRAIQMNADETRKRTGLAVGLISSFIVLCVVAIFVAPSVITGVRSAITLNPNNFRNASVEFFQSLSDNKIEIYSFSLNEPLQVEHEKFDIRVISLERDIEHYKNQDNKKAHANGTVLVYACH